MLPIRSEILGGVQLWSMGRQKPELDVTFLVVDILAYQSPPVRRQVIPHGQQLLCVQMERQRIEKGDDIGGANDTRRQLEVDVPEANTGDRRQLPLREPILQHQRLNLGSLGTDAMRALGVTGVYEADKFTVSGAFLLSAGRPLVLHCSTAVSPRRTARPLGRSLGMPSRRRKRQRPDLELRWPVDVSTRFLGHGRIHRLVRDASASAPGFNAAPRRLCSSGLSNGSRPVRRTAIRSRRPLLVSARSHRTIGIRLTFSRQATSAGWTPRCNSIPPSVRLASSSVRSNRFDFASSTRIISPSEMGSVNYFIRTQ